MAQIKTAELEGAALDWAVAKCEGEVSDDIDDFCLSVKGEFNYSTNWALSGPIIERERLWIEPYGVHWAVSMHNGSLQYHGLTLLITAMRCYVASKLGDVVEVPDELVKG